MAFVSDSPRPARLARITVPGLRRIAGWLAVVGSVVAAVGWLYLLRHVGALNLGPRASGALPLQQLAGGDAQPLARLAVVWLPAGALASLALARCTRLGRAARVAAVAAVAAVVLVASGAASDAIAVSSNVAAYLPDQAGRTGIWVAVALLAAGAAVRPPAGTRVRLTGALLALWMLLGACGAWTYGHDYWTYRGFPPPVDPTAVAAGRIEQQSFYSPALGQRRTYLIYLPPGYTAAARQGTRFPVLYLLHGSPGQPQQFVNAGAVGIRMDTLASTHAIRPYILVMPSGSDGTFRSTTEWANTPHGRYEDLVLDTVHNVDQRFSTVANRGGRAIAGYSEGAYAAANIALQHLNAFSVAESWSGYFIQKPAGVFTNASPAQLWANSPAEYVTGMRAAIAKRPLHVFLYGGRRDPGSARNLPGFAAALPSAGAAVSTAIVPGGHDWAVWRAQVPQMLRFADANLVRG